MNLAQIWKQWQFYFTHSWRDLSRNGVRTIFAVFCIATGVTAVVALRSLALMIGDELTTNLAQINRGDIRIAASDDIEPEYFELSTQGEEVFSEAGMRALEEWATDENVEIQFASNFNLLQLLPRDTEGNIRNPVSVVPILIEPEIWPYYDQVFTVAPDVRSLNEFFTDEDERSIILSQRAAQDNQLSVGDVITVGSNEDLYTIVALVPDETEGSLLLRNGLSGLLGFIYFPLERADELGLSPLPDQAFIQMQLGRSVENLEQSLVERFGPNIPRTTTTELEAQNSEAADLVNDLILVMGLSSVLIGGVGIINTMLVIVGRRTLEIAVLKTMGLKAWRVTLLFMVEALLMGIIGSIIGIIAGIILSYLVRNIGEEALQAELSWRAYPAAWFNGLTLGLIITLVFGFLPTLVAGQVRPASVLRPNEAQMPNAGLRRTVFALLSGIVIFGLTLNGIVRNQLNLPPSMMLGLGGVIVGLFAGVMLANEKVLDELTERGTDANAKRGLIVLAGSLAGMTLITLFLLDNLFGMNLPDLSVYGAPALLGVSVHYGIRPLAMRRQEVTSSVIRAARQLVLFGGSIMMGLLTGLGVALLISAVLGILFPDQRTEIEAIEFAIPNSIIYGGIIGLPIGLLSIVAFRVRGRHLAGTVGLALIAAGVLGILGSVTGDILRIFFENTFLWEALTTISAGIVVVEIAFLFLSITFVLLWGVVWLVGRLPAFGSVDIKLSIRNISARKSRTASTMLGLIAGVAALSLITLTTNAVTSLLEQQIETDAGGNVFILTRDENTSLAVQKRLDSRLEGVKTYSQFTLYSGRILRIDGEEPEAFAEFEDFGDEADGNRTEFGRVEGEEGFGFPFTVVDPNQDRPEYEMDSGRFLTEDDIGEPVMVLREPLPNTFFDRLDIEVGTIVTLLMFPNPGSGQDPFEMDFEIIGIIDRDSEQAGAADTLQAPTGTIPEYVSPNAIITVADIEEENVQAAMVEFAQISNVFVLEIGFIVQFVERLLGQLTAIPTLVAILALVAGTAIIANTVALDTQERRHQIGVMKAIGLKGKRVLAQMIFENAFMGFIAGLIGAGIGILVTILIGILGEAEQLSDTLSLSPVLLLITMAVLVSMIATLTSAWTAARESPMDVLRYE